MNKVNLIKTKAGGEVLREGGSPYQKNEQRTTKEEILTLKQVIEEFGGQPLFLQSYNVIDDLALSGTDKLGKLSELLSIPLDYELVRGRNTATGEPAYYYRVNLGGFKVVGDYQDTRMNAMHDASDFMLFLIARELFRKEHRPRARECITPFKLVESCEVDRHSESIAENSDVEKECYTGESECNVGAASGSISDGCITHVPSVHRYVSDSSCYITESFLNYLEIQSSKIFTDMPGVVFDYELRGEQKWECSLILKKERADGGSERLTISKGLGHSKGSAKDTAALVVMKRLLSGCREGGSGGLVCIESNPGPGIGELVDYVFDESVQVDTDPIKVVQVAQGSLLYSQQVTWCLIKLGGGDQVCLPRCFGDTFDDVIDRGTNRKYGGVKESKPVEEKGSKSGGEGTQRHGAVGEERELKRRKLSSGKVEVSNEKERTDRMKRIYHLARRWAQSTRSGLDIAKYILKSTDPQLTQVYLEQVDISDLQVPPSTCDSEAMAMLTRKVTSHVGDISTRPARGLFHLAFLKNCRGWKVHPDDYAKVFDISVTDIHNDLCILKLELESRSEWYPTLISMFNEYVSPVKGSQHGDGSLVGVETNPGPKTVMRTPGGGRPVYWPEGFRHRGGGNNHTDLESGGTFQEEVTDIMNKIKDVMEEEHPTPWGRGMPGFKPSVLEPAFEDGGAAPWMAPIPTSWSDVSPGANKDLVWVSAPARATFEVYWQGKWYNITKWNLLGHSNYRVPRGAEYRYRYTGHKTWHHHWAGETDKEHNTPVPTGNPFHPGGGGPKQPVNEWGTRPAEPGPDSTEEPVFPIEGPGGSEEVKPSTPLHKPHEEPEVPEKPEGELPQHTEPKFLEKAGLDDRLINLTNDDFYKEVNDRFMAFPESKMSKKPGAGILWTPKLWNYFGSNYSAKLSGNDITKEAILKTEPKNKVDAAAMIHDELLMMGVDWNKANQWLARELKKDGIAEGVIQNVVATLSVPFLELASGKPDENIENEVVKELKKLVGLYPKAKPGDGVDNDLNVVEVMGDKVTMTNQELDQVKSALAKVGYCVYSQGHRKCIAPHGLGGADNGADQLNSQILNDMQKPETQIVGNLADVVGDQTRKTILDTGGDNNKTTPNEPVIKLHQAAITKYIMEPPVAIIETLDDQFTRSLHEMPTIDATLQGQRVAIGKALPLCTGQDSHHMNFNVVWNVNGADYFAYTIRANLYNGRNYLCSKLLEDMATKYFSQDGSVIAGLQRNVPNSFATNIRTNIGLVQLLYAQEGPRPTEGDKSIIMRAHSEVRLLMVWLSHSLQRWYFLKPCWNFLYSNSYARLNNPVAIGGTLGNQFPLSSNANAAVNVRSCSYDEFVREAVAGDILAAGFGRETWGDTCAVVPMDPNDGMSDMARSLWVIMHLESPTIIQGWNTRYIRADIGGNDISGGVNRQTYPNVPRIDGPRNNVLLVLRETTSNAWSWSAANQATDRISDITLADNIGGGTVIGGDANAASNRAINFPNQAQASIDIQAFVRRVGQLNCYPEEVYAEVLNYLFRQYGITKKEYEIAFRVMALSMGLYFPASVCGYSNGAANLANHYGIDANDANGTTAVTADWDPRGILDFHPTTAEINQIHGEVENGCGMGPKIVANIRVGGGDSEWVAFKVPYFDDFTHALVGCGYLTFSENRMGIINYMQVSAVHRKLEFLSLMMRFMYDYSLELSCSDTTELANANSQQCMAVRQYPKHVALPWEATPSEWFEVHLNSCWPKIITNKWAGAGNFGDSRRGVIDRRVSTLLHGPLFSGLGMEGGMNIPYDPVLELNNEKWAYYTDWDTSLNDDGAVAQVTGYGRPIQTVKIGATLQTELRKLNLALALTDTTIGLTSWSTFNSPKMNEGIYIRYTSHPTGLCSRIQNFVSLFRQFNETYDTLGLPMGSPPVTAINRMRWLVSNEKRFSESKTAWQNLLMPSSEWKIQIQPKLQGHADFELSFSDDIDAGKGPQHVGESKE